MPVPLILIPTDLEHRRLIDLGGFPKRTQVQAAGFGPIAAAITVTRLCTHQPPTSVLLLGIAGTYNPTLHPPGSALCFSSVELDGIGVGTGPRHRGPASLGFPQLPRSPSDPKLDEDRIELTDPTKSGALLLTTCAASDSSEHANERLTRHPDAVAEDMEGYAVALACRAAGVPLTIVRGLSNPVGERDPSKWCIPAALAAAHRLTLEILDNASATPR